MNRPNPEASLAGEQRYVSTAQVALALGVSVTTVKRWVDDNVIPAHRTAGGHRKLLMADVLRIVRSGNLPHADLSKLLPAPRATGADPDDTRVQLVAAIDAGDGELIRTLIIGAYQQGMAVEDLADRVVSPALQHVGHEWAAGRMEVMREHRVTQACVSAMYELRGFLRVNAEPDRPVAVGGAPEHDHYLLPSLLAKLTLLDAGWDAVNLGPHTPMSAFAHTLDHLNPQLIWVSVTHLVDEDQFVRDYTGFFRQADDRGVAVAVGGRGLTEAIRNRIPYTSFGDGLTHLALFAKTLHRRPGRPKRGRPPGRKATETDGPAESSPGVSD